MLKTLEKYYEEGLLLKQTHPTHDLTIWNYSPLVQYERKWDSVTLAARGLVTNSKGEIIARPFHKFFNYEELIDKTYGECKTCQSMGLRHCAHPEECGASVIKPYIPNEPFEVYEKMDGSLGIFFYYKNEWIMATRGSFTSPQSIKGREIIDKNFDVTELNTSYTYLFEIIYPENRIVCEYKEETVVLLGAIKSDTGEEMDRKSLKWYSMMCGYPLVKKYDGIEDYKLLKELVSNDAEGFVIRFQSGFRMKIKGDEYCRLHRILTNISSRNIWEYLKEGKPLDELLDKVPDEFYNWVKDTVTNFEVKFEEIKSKVESDFRELVNKKEYAEKVLKNPYKHLLFTRLDSYSNKLNDMIWDMLYPEFEKPFKNEYDEA